MGFSVWGQALQTHADCVASLGDLDRARGLYLKAIEVSREHGLTEALGWALGIAIEETLLTGESAPGSAADEARQYGFEGVQLAQRSGSPYQHTHAYRALGSAHLIDAAWGDAIEAYEHALGIARTQTGREQEALILAHLSAAHLGAGDRVRARAHAEEAVAVGREQGTRPYEVRAQLALARVLRAESGAHAGQEIERCLDRADALVAETGSRVFAPQILEERARLEALRGRLETARQQLEASRERYVEVGAHAHARRLAAELRVS